MQLFVIQWSASEIPSYRQAVARFVAELGDQAGQSAEGGRLEGAVRVLARAHLPQSRSGITLCEAEDLTALQGHLGPWMARYGFTYTVDAALRDAEMVAFLDSIKHLR